MISFYVTWQVFPIHFHIRRHVTEIADVITFCKYGHQKLFRIVCLELAHIPTKFRVLIISKTVKWEGGLNQPPLRVTKHWKGPGWIGLRQKMPFLGVGCSSSSSWYFSLKLWIMLVLLSSNMCPLYVSKRTKHCLSNDQLWRNLKYAKFVLTYI